MTQTTLISSYIIFMVCSTYLIYTIVKNIIEAKKQLRELKKYRK